MQANKPPMNRTPTAVQADSNRSVCSASITSSETMALAVASDGLPSGSGNSGKLPLLFSAKSIHARTSGESTVNADVYSRSRAQKSSKLPASGSSRGSLPALAAAYMPLASSIVVPISVASPCT